jgi:hypothetical protein
MFLALTLDQAKTVSEIVHHITIVVAVVIGGSWTVFTFVRFGHVAKAKAELEKQLVDIEVQRKLLRESAVLEAQVVASQVKLQKHKDKYISAVVAIKNVGNRDTYIMYSEAHFFVTPVSYTADGAMVYGKLTAANYPSPSGRNWLATTIPPAFTREIPYTFRVSEPGIYLISFEAKAYDETGEAAKKFEKQEMWCTAMAFIAVD